ncbi:MAG TPA: type II CAAX endopeptidase family protein [Bacteroidales bacterium]|nr:type II CAAX endopeptidase family protein [Bacteroidales bacterium]HPT01300.1 type II CAAX endopeptidase family protein [Bacteroidales bacterium]
MNDFKTRNYIALIVGFVCILVILFGHRLLPVGFFYAEMVSYLVCLTLIILVLRFVLGLSLRDHFFSYADTGEGSLLKKFPLLSGLLLSLLLNLTFLLIGKSGFNNLLGGRDMNLFQNIFLVVAGAPVIEEVLFRGYIQDLIKAGFFSRQNRNVTTWFPIVITSLIFAALHLFYLGTAAPLQLVFIVMLALSIGLLSGFLRSKYHHIKYSVKLHIGANLGGVLVIPVALLAGIIGKPEFQEMTKTKEACQFDMNNNAAFSEDLSQFFSSELKLNDAAEKTAINCWIPCLIHCDKNGNILSVSLDTAQAKRSGYDCQTPGIEEDALKTLKKLPKFVPAKGMTKDTTIQHTFYVYNPGK